MVAEPCSSVEVERIYDLVRKFSLKPSRLRTGVEDVDSEEEEEDGEEEEESEELEELEGVVSVVLS